jgi:hypothetical protein
MIVQVDKFFRGRPGIYAAATGSISLESVFLTLPTRALTGQQINVREPDLDVLGLERHQAPAHHLEPTGVGGSQPAVRQAGLFVLVSEAYLAAPPTQEMVRLSRG